MTNAKTKCVSCGNPLPGTEDYYIYHGNYCSSCGGRHSRLAIISQNLSRINHKEQIGKLTKKDIKKRNELIKERKKERGKEPREVTAKSYEDYLEEYNKKCRKFVNRG